MMESRTEECSQLIKKEFPAIDEDLFQYISGRTEAPVLYF